MNNSKQATTNRKNHSKQIERSTEKQRSKKRKTKKQSTKVKNTRLIDSNQSNAMWGSTQEDSEKNNMHNRPQRKSKLRQTDQISGSAKKASVKKKPSHPKMTDRNTKGSKKKTEKNKSQSPQQKRKKNQESEKLFVPSNPKIEKRPMRKQNNSHPQTGKNRVQKSSEKSVIKKGGHRKKKTTLMPKIIYFFFCFSCLTLLFSFITLYAANRYEFTIFNHRVVRLNDNGMLNNEHAALRPEDLVLVRNKEVSTLHPNNIVVFKNSSGNDFIARSFIDIDTTNSEQGYQLRVRGDGAAFGEEMIEVEQYVGEVSMSIIRVADVFRFIDFNLILSVIFCFSLIALLVLLGIYLFT